MKQLPEQSFANLKLNELLARCSYAPDRASRAAKSWNDQLHETHQRAVRNAASEGYALRPEVEAQYAVVAVSSV